MEMPKSLLLCPRLTDQAIPLKTEAVKHACDLCGEQIWIMPVNLDLAMPKICSACGRELLEKCRKTGEEVNFFPASAARELNK